VLSTNANELIALAIRIAVHCDGCIAYHVHAALKAHATRREIAETIGVAVMMGGGPSVVYGCEALEAVEQFEQLAAR
jgi:AhpD family alkylhydroperoxidase